MTGLLQAVRDPLALHCGPDYVKEPKRTVADLSAPGLSHNGYSIPSNLVDACVTGCVDSGPQIAGRGLSRISPAISMTRLRAT